MLFPQYFSLQAAWEGLKKYIFFNIFVGGEQFWNCPKTPLNKTKIS